MNEPADHRERRIILEALETTLLVEAVANGLVEIGLAPDQIRTERFGPTGSTA